MKPTNFMPRMQTQPTGRTGRIGRTGLMAGWIAAFLLVSTAALAQPMTTKPMPATEAMQPAQTRQQVKMETKEFLSTHTWDANTDVWSLKSGVEPPTGVMSRATVKAQRDEFMRNNRWDNAISSYVPIKPAPRELSTLTRAEMRAETVQFMRTHRWDEPTEMWIENPPARKKK